MRNSTLILVKAILENMRIALLLTIFFTYSFTTVGQGFYDHNNLLINRKSIIKLNISSVTATTFYPDSCFHPLSNFVFEYKFDRSGNINKRKYWNTQLDGNNYLYVTLVIDTIYFIPQFQRFNYYCVSQSKVVKFNQYKERKRLYIRKVFNKLGLMQSQNNNCWSRGTEESDFFVDTTLLNKRVNIPRWLIPAGDSIALFKDTLLVFNKNEASIGIDSKSYLTDDSILQIDLLLDEVTNRVWRSYYINSLGLVYKLTQNIYTELYYYNSDNLHVKTETFVNDYRSTRTIFNYKYNPHHD